MNSWSDMTARAYEVVSVSLRSQGIAECSDMKAQHGFNVERDSWVCLSSAVPQFELFVYTDQA